MPEHAEYVRDCAHVGLEPQVDVALAADHLASGRIMMFASVVIFLALPFVAHAHFVFMVLMCVL